MQRLIYLGGVGLLGLLLYSQAVRGDQLAQVQILEINAPKGQEATQTYIWRQNFALKGQNLGFVPLSKVLPGAYYLYLGADDGVNQPVNTVAHTPSQIGSATTALAEDTWGSTKASRG